MMLTLEIRHSATASKVHIKADEWVEEVEHLETRITGLKEALRWMKRQKKIGK